MSPILLVSILLITEPTFLVISCSLLLLVCFNAGNLFHTSLIITSCNSYKKAWSSSLKSLKLLFGSAIIFSFRLFFDLICISYVVVCLSYRLVFLFQFYHPFSYPNKLDQLISSFVTLSITSSTQSFIPFFQAHFLCSTAALYCFLCCSTSSQLPDHLLMLY